MIFIINYLKNMLRRGLVSINLFQLTIELQYFSGYLVSGAHGHKSASEYICLDSDAEMLAGGVANTDGRVIYLVEGICGTLKCPPYVQGRELTCVVCSK
jgi:hypothetical protein